VCVCVCVCVFACVCLRVCVCVCVRVCGGHMHTCVQYDTCVAEAMFQSVTLVTGSCSLLFPSQLTVHHLPSSSSEAPGLATNTGSEGI